MLLLAGRHNRALLLPYRPPSSLCPPLTVFSAPINNMINFLPNGARHGPPSSLYIVVLCTYIHSSMIHMKLRKAILHSSSQPRRTPEHYYYSFECTSFSPSSLLLYITLISSEKGVESGAGGAAEADGDAQAESQARTQQREPRRPAEDAAPSSASLASAVHLAAPSAPQKTKQTLKRQHHETWD